jgi:putative ABC transport system permease protein
MSSFVRDFRHAMRALVRRPVFLAVAAGTLALGIGATTSIFSVVHAVLLNPLPYPTADRLAVLFQRHLERGPERDLVAPGVFLEWRRRQTVFDRFAAISPWGLDYVGSGDPESVPAVLVSEGYFEALGVHPYLGRTLIQSDFQRSTGNFRGSGADALVLTHEYWARRFGSDTSIVGRTLTFSDRPYTIVGILPAGFRSPVYPGRDVYGPLIFWPGAEQDRRSAYLGVIGRRKSGVSVDEAQAALRLLGTQLAADHPVELRGVGIDYVPVREQLVGRVELALTVLLAAVSCILLIACANIANLLLARASERRGEFALRTALGASPRRLVRQLLTESLALAIAGCLAGALLAVWGIRLVKALAPANIPRLDEAALNLPVALFAATATVATALLIGLVPAWSAARSSVSQTLRESSPATSPTAAQHRLRSVFMVAQVALAMVLLLGAGLLVRSFAQLVGRDLGFDASHVATLQVYAYTRNPTPESRVTYFERAVDALRAVPGVTAAAVAQAPPLVPGGGDVAIPIVAEGVEARAADGQETAWANTVGPGFFNVLGVHFRAGRDVATTDQATTAPVAVVNETMARRVWRDTNPVGRRFAVLGPSGRRTMEVIGVVADYKQLGLDDRPRPQFFVPHTQNSTGGMVFVARTIGDPRVALDAIRGAIWSVNQAQPFYAVATLDELLDRTLAQRRFAMLLLASFAGLAAILAALGTYGVISYLATQRRQEFGIRVAMGARPAQIVWSVVRGALAWVGTGVAAGAVAALALSGLLRAMLFEISPWDPLTLAATAMLLVGIAAAASWAGARRATSVDPVATLRGQ